MSQRCVAASDLLAHVNASHSHAIVFVGLCIDLS